MTRWRTFQTPLFCGGVLYGLQDEATGQVVAYDSDMVLPDEWHMRLQAQAEESTGHSGIIIKPRRQRTVFEVFLADVRMLSKASVPPELMQSAVADMIDRWNRRDPARWRPPRRGIIS